MKFKYALAFPWIHREQQLDVKTIKRDNSRIKMK